MTLFWNSSQYYLLHLPVEHSQSFALFSRSQLLLFHSSRPSGVECSVEIKLFHKPRIVQFPLFLRVSKLHLLRKFISQSVSTKTIRILK